VCALTWSSLLTSLLQEELAKKRTEEKKDFFLSIIDKVVSDKVVKDQLARVEAKERQIAELREQLNKKTN
jgi:hypothetical protein